MSQSERWQKRLDLPLLAAALATIPLLIIDETNAGAPWRTISSVGNWLVWGLFAVDLIVMLYLAEDRWRYLRRHPVEWIVVVVTPPLVPAGVQWVRVVRILRVLRLLRFGPIARRFFSLEGIRYAFVLAGVALFAGAAAYSAAEHHSYATGLYWAIQTLTTVGYGDVSPVTALGRVIACVLMLVGIGFFAVVTGAIAQRFVAAEIQETVVELDASDEAILAQISALADQIKVLEATVRERGRTS